MRCNDIIKEDLRKVLKDSKFIPNSVKHICSELFYTSYMSTPNNSDNTRNYAKELASSIGSNHSEIDIQKIVDSYLEVFENQFNFKRTRNFSIKKNFCLF